MELNTKNGAVNIYAKTIEDAAISQIIELANSPLGENAHIRIMPDVHAGAGCVIGTTMKYTDKICPNIVGVDIGCGVALAQTNLDFEQMLPQLDTIIRKTVPCGRNIHQTEKDFNFAALKCWDKLTKEVQETARHSLGTLGGGNHFIEAYNGGYIAVHTGSRNIGNAVAKYYQKKAEAAMYKERINEYAAQLKQIEPKLREKWIEEHKIIKTPVGLSYLTGEDLQDYIHDVHILQDFAAQNRYTILDTIVHNCGGRILNIIETVHNYVDTEHNIIRKGAVAAYEGQILTIPMNMRDGMLVCRGKGNEEWNCSAPHGAGRLYSRAAAKKEFTIEQYEEAMAGIYTSCINKNTLDEAPFAYKNWEEIVEYIEPTVDIIARILPVYNFKAGE